MERKELMNAVQDIFRDVFDNDELEINDETCAEDIEEWDSLAHIQLVIGIKRKLNVEITAAELRSWDNVGEMIDSLMEKLD